MVMFNRCLNSRAPQYLAIHCIPLSSKRHLCSASEMTYIVSGGALNSTHSLTHSLTLFR